METTLNNFADDNDVKSTVIQFRAPPRLLEAIKRAKAQSFTSISDYARMCISEKLRASGLLPEQTT
jgi:hypothetical protein